jgi:uncharacterized damage-inducible protein DinB/ubiquinone/menaquinone biosynthesis C-methylase UbiE
LNHEISKGEYLMTTNHVEQQTQYSMTEDLPVLVTEQATPLTTFCKVWERHHQRFIAIVTYLETKQLALPVAPHSAVSIRDLLIHMIDSRIFWFSEWMGEENIEMIQWREERSKSEAYEVAELVTMFEKTWQVISSALARWTDADLKQVFPPPASLSSERRSGEQTRQEIVCHAHEHEIHHGGELSLALGGLDLQGIYGGLTPDHSEQPMQDNTTTEGLPIVDQQNLSSPRTQIGAAHTLVTTIMDDLIGLVKSRAISLAAQLRLADLVKDGPKSITELAQATGTNKIALYRLLYALVQCGYFEEVEPEVFAQSVRSHLLRTDLPRSLYSLAMIHGDVWQWHPWENAIQALQTGKPVFNEMFGKDLWHYFQEDNPEAGQRFNAAMSVLSKQNDHAIARSYDFSVAGTIVDVAGGHGSLLTAILQIYPTTHGILFDQPSVIETVQQRHLTENFQGRLELVSGNIFTAVPAGADTYQLKQIMQDWEDGECVQILLNCRKAMKPGGRVLVMEEITTPGKKASAMGALIDLQLQLVMKGHHRSAAEHSQLFEAAGLRLVRVYPTQSSYTVLEAAAL